MNELVLGAMLCSFLGGAEAEVRVDFDAGTRAQSNRIDCLTEHYAFEFGLDKRSARDSVHQAVFAAEMTNTEPVVVIFDTDGVEGKFEYEIRLVTEALGIAYARCHRDLVVRWATTAAFRQKGLDRSQDDLPTVTGYGQSCTLPSVASN